MIRDATHADIPALVGMGERFFLESGYSKEATFDPATFESTLRSLIDGDSGILIITEGGMAGALVYPMYFNASILTGQELFYWISPEHRGGGVALLDALESRAKALGAKTFSMICLDTLRPEAVGRLYERRGYRKSEHSYIKRL